MKLMTPPVVKDLISKELSREILRTQEMEKVAGNIRKKLASAEADFKTTLANQREIWAKDEEAHAKRVTEMTAEIATLEHQREQALIPIKMVRDQADKTLLEAQNALQGVRDKENDLDDIRERLEATLDALGAREQDIILKEQKLVSRERGIEDQQAQVIEGSKGVSQRLIELAQMRAEAEERIDARKTECVLIERSLVAKDERLKTKEQELRIFEIQLQDERQTLERAMKRDIPLETKKKDL